MFTTAPLSQRDPRWSSLQLGFGDANSTIGNYGCTLSCLTLLANGYGFSETPATLNDKLKALGPGVGYAGDTRNLMLFTALDLALPGMRYLDRAWCDAVPAPMDRINAALDANQAVVIQLDQSPTPFFQQHWVLLYGREGGDYLIHDPWTWPTERRVSINRDYGFTGTVEKIITHCVFYEGPSQPPPPVGPLIIIVNDDPDIIEAGGLALRDQPALGSRLIKRVAANTELGLQEDSATAITKMGQPGQWLHVATNGSRGFVAAWLVHAQEVATRAARPISPIKQPASRRQVQPDWNRITLVVNRPAKASSAANPASPRLRSKPSTGKVIAELRPNTALQIVGSQRIALKKIGVRGQWIKVRDNQGHIGYISALHVHVRKSNAAKKPTAKG